MSSWSKDWVKYIDADDDFDIYPIQFANTERIEKNPAVYLFDETGCLGHIGGERGYAGEVVFILAFVAVEQGPCTQRNGRLQVLSLFENVQEVGLQEVDFIAHRSGRIYDEEDIGRGFRG